ncbi:MAG: HNH endonuclease [bacterium]
MQRTMPDLLPAVVANTDPRWFEHFRPSDKLRIVDEVNFWRPSAQSQFRALQLGEPLFFRLKHPVNAVAGFGFLAVAMSMSVEMAWEFFGERNGDPTRARFESRIVAYRDRFERRPQDHLSCLVLRDAVFLPEAYWVPWRAEQGWKPNIVSYKGYDLARAPGESLAGLLNEVHPAPVADFLPEFELDQRRRAETVAVQREGQGAFRLRLLNAYGHCAVTGEHAVPVLEAAHITPYLGPRSNHLQNGLILRSDLHRLYDAGYVTVTPDLHFAVSGKLREEFENGKAYYAMDGQRLTVPADSRAQPSRSALLWHAENVFK